MLRWRASKKDIFTKLLEMGPWFKAGAFTLPCSFLATTFYGVCTVAVTSRTRSS